MRAPRGAGGRTRPALAACLAGALLALTASACAGGAASAPGTSAGLVAAPAASVATGASASAGRAPAASAPSAGPGAGASTATATAAAVPATAHAAASPAVEALEPPLHHWWIPYGPQRRQEMAEYSLLHYGEDTYRLIHPKVIVEHFTETAGASEAWNTFAPDVPDSEFHALPGTCAHFLVEPDGRIDQLVPLNIRCRHTTGLNWTAIGIENIGFSDAQILGDRAQLQASLRLTRWLRCRYRIPLHDVIGHNESLSSPYHHDRVPAFQHQTHSDWSHADMQRYRALLGGLSCPPAA